MTKIKDKLINLNDYVKYWVNQSVRYYIFIINNIL